MASESVGHVIFCDDVRMEMGNKPSYMGCYVGGEMQCPFPFPGFLPKFVIAAWVIMNAHYTPEFMTISAKMPDGTILPPVEVSPAAFSEPTKDFKKRIVGITMPMAPFPIVCEGNLEVFAKTEEGEVRIGLLKITQAQGHSVLSPGRNESA